MKLENKANTNKYNPFDEQRTKTPTELNRSFRKIPIIGYFWQASFFHYVWTGGLFTLLNIFLVWLFIEVLQISTVVSSSVVIGGLFILRYVFYRWVKILK